MLVFPIFFRNEGIASEENRIIEQCAKLESKVCTLKNRGKYPLILMAGKELYSN
jgi:hypothetical protein